MSSERRLCVEETQLSGHCVLERRTFRDARGSFSRLFDQEQLAEAGLALSVAQINYSVTRQRGTVRGLHLQRAHEPESKYISCIGGEIFDVAVDLRPGSPTFLRWHGVLLSEDNQRTVVVPPGCAHGFQVLSDGCALVYVHNAPYRPSVEDGVHPLDPALAIAWPLPVIELSERDRSWPWLVNGPGGVQR